MVYRHDELTIVNDNKIKAGLPLSRTPAHNVYSYQELLQKVANLNFYNKDLKLLYRGQKKDYQLNKHSTGSNLFPSILRTASSEFNKSRIKELDLKFDKLKNAEQVLKNELKDFVSVFDSKILNLLNNKILLWSLIQHYEIHETPLLDVTDSLQTALTFAIGKRNTGYLFILGFPQLTAPISISIESETQVIDLSQICLPEALRPHFQKGILVGDYPIYETTDQTHGEGGKIGNNFSTRLVTKFKLNNCRKWYKEGFIPTKKSILFPDKDDEFYKLAQIVKNKL